MNKQTEQRIQTIVAVVALGCLLAYTFVHTWSLLARYVYPPFVGGIAAFGIELVVAFISYRLATLKRSSKKSNVLISLLAFALLVSVLANVAEGYQVKFGQELTVSNIGNIDFIQAFVGLAATGLLSVMVFAVSEIVGSDVDTVVKRAERERKQEDKGEQEAVDLSIIGQTPAQAIGEQGEQSYQESVYTLLDQGEPASPTVIATKANCSKATASKWIRAWEGEQIAVSTNGKYQGVSDEYKGT